MGEHRHSEFFIHCLSFIDSGGIYACLTPFFNQFPFGFYFPLVPPHFLTLVVVHVGYIALLPLHVSRSRIEITPTLEKYNENIDRHNVFLSDVQVEVLKISE